MFQNNLVGNGINDRFGTEDNNINNNTNNTMTNPPFHQLFDQNQNSSTPQSDINVEHTNMNNNTKDQNAMSINQKLLLAERANQIYNQQLKFMQDTLQQTQQALQEKINIIGNLIARYDLGVIQKDYSRQDDNLSVDAIDHEEFKRKAEALAQRTILENFELREIVNELRDENFRFRNEIYELKDQNQRFIIQVSQLENEIAQYESSKRINLDNMDGMNINENRDLDQYDANNFNGLNNSHGNNNNNYQNGQLQRKSKESNQINPQNITNVEDMMDPANTEDAKRIRAEREQKQNKRESYTTPNLYSTAENDEDGNNQNLTNTLEAGNDDDDADADADSEHDDLLSFFKSFGGKQAQPSQQIENKTINSINIQEPNIKKEDQQQQYHTRQSSTKLNNNNLVSESHNPENESKIQLNKKPQDSHHRNQSSLAIRQLFGDDGDDDLNDPKVVDKARKEQRRKSRQLVMKHVGDKGHLSDEDVQVPSGDKPLRYDYNLRKKTQNKDDKNVIKEPTILEEKQPLNNEFADEQNKPKNDTNTLHEKNKSINAYVSEDPELQLHFEKLKVVNLSNELELKLQELNESKKKISNMEIDAKNTANNLKTLIDDKTNFIQKTSSEITRLTIIINRLLRIPKIHDVVETVVEESSKQIY